MVAKILYEHIRGRFRVHAVRVGTVLGRPNVDVAHGHLRDYCGEMVGETICLV